MELTMKPMPQICGRKARLCINDNDQQAMFCNRS